MTVKELRDLLKDVDGDVLVIMSKDGEGNGYSPLADTNLGQYLYEADTTWSGDLIDVDEADADTEAVPCVVLWPTN